jgi:hypothetical protein
VWAREVLHGVVNQRRIDGKDAVRQSAPRPGIRSRRRGHSIGTVAGRQLIVQDTCRPKDLDDRAMALCQ